jgi:hypothetical protein
MRGLDGLPDHTRTLLGSHRHSRGDQRGRQKGAEKRARLEHHLTS